MLRCGLNFKIYENYDSHLTRSIYMKDKVKTTMIVVTIVAGIAWFIYFMGGRAVDFMAKLHGG